MTPKPGSRRVRMFRERHYTALGSPFSRSRSAIDTTEPAGQAGSSTCHAGSGGRALTCAAPGGR